jgi:hypothetical protein
MAKITKRAVDALQRGADRDVFLWDSELRGFGIRAKPSGVKTFFIQYRNIEGRTRRLVLGQYGVLTAEIARHLARKKLTAVADGADPSAIGILSRLKRVGFSVETADRSRRRRSRVTAAGSTFTSSRCSGAAL